MLILNGIGEDAGRYYFGPTPPGRSPDAAPPGRSPDAAPPGRWCGGGRRDLGLDGLVTRAALDAVLGGRRPDDGTALSTRRTPHRRAGWDLIFTAPKSVSLLAAVGGGDMVAAAHRRACADAFVWLETHAAWARRRGALVATSGFVAARFGHLVNAAGEPHLHTHVLVANVARAEDGRWSAVDGGGLWLQRRAVAALYHLALRQQLLAAGLRPDWAVRPDGTADLAEVPRRAVEATSTRRRQIQHRLAGTDDPPPLTRTAAQRLTREEAAGAGSWRGRAQAAGFGADHARRVIDDARRRAQTPTRPYEPDAVGRRLAEDVTVWLAQRRSTFSVVDVVQALAAAYPEGTTAPEAYRWARQFYEGAIPASDGRRTTALARAGDEALLRLAGPGRDPADPGRPGTALDRLTAGAPRVTVLGPPDPPPTTGGWPVTASKGGFVAQAAVLDAARVHWQGNGRTVAVAAPSEAAARRWRALAGLDRHPPGTPPPDMLIVDRADRRTTAELIGILQHSAPTTTVVLVEGGTLPARRAAISQGLQWVAQAQGRIVPPALATPTELATPARRVPIELRHPGEVPVAPGRTEADPAKGVTAGRLTAYPLGQQAVEHVVATWSRLRQDGTTPRMVGLGPAECDELNRRARAVLRSNGALTGAEVVVGGRPFAIGDEVIATRRGPLPAGAIGHVSQIDPGRGSILVEWSGPSSEVNAWNARHLRHAYATTPGMLRFDDGPVVALGEPGDLGRHHHRLVAGVVVAATGPHLGLAGRVDEARRAHVEGLTRIAETDPGRAGLDPLPADAPGRRRWRIATGRTFTQRASGGDVPTLDRPTVRPPGPDLGL